MFTLKDSKSRKDRAILVNWLEDRVAQNRRQPFKNLFIAITLIFIFKIKCKELIWIRHNIKPHVNNQSVIQTFCYNILFVLLKLFSTKIVTHRKVEDLDSKVIPHPLYSANIDFVRDRDIEYICFGKIMRYKNIPKMLKDWPSNKKLLLIGYCDDSDLDLEITSIISDNKNIEYVNKFVGEKELNEYIARCKYVLLPHSDNSMIVSGAFYHAISLGANVISSRNDFSRHIEAKHKFVSIVDDFSADSLEQIQYYEPKVVIQSAYSFYGEPVIKKSWKEFLGI
ncbi:hypothetical protein P3371_12565 [Vibrio parahaemolyticus]|nr:hypothetical protein [Vibrio parahaemolyticus]MDG2548089.1 hypothetical protein [Vibrio parahaemolyticus]MDG2558199.1 hypothetical protein [Vibrio parahaemolyticus]